MKTRYTLSICTLLAIQAIAAPSLIGTWKSNKELTIKTIHLPATVTKDAKKRFENLFGRMTITYTKSQSIARMAAYAEFEDWESTSSYRIVAETKNKLSIKGKEQDADEETLETLHFVNQNQYWIELPIGEGQLEGREYFDRQLKPVAEPQS